MKKVYAEFICDQCGEVLKIDKYVSGLTENVIGLWWTIERGKNYCSEACYKDRNRVDPHKAVGVFGG